MSCALITIWILLSGRTQRLSRKALASISPKPLPCSKCGKSYGSKSTLNRHLREECGMRPQSVCCYCRKAIHQRSNFKRHIEKVHGCMVSSYITSRNLDNFTIDSLTVSIDSPRNCAIKAILIIKRNEN